MAFRFTLEDDAIVIFISGALTFHQHKEGEQLVYQITALLNKGDIRTIRMNFAGVQRMDSHWLGVLIRVLRRVHEKKAAFVIEKPNADVSRLFEMVELSRIAEIRD